MEENIRRDPVFKLYHIKRKNIEITPFLYILKYNLVKKF